jgi:hypothetical protein
MTPSQITAIEEIVSLFDSAEEKVKEVELLTQELSIPSINELRYVGYHLARALCEKNETELNLQIEKAKGHCKRAIYDAHEIGIIYLLEQVKVFKETHLNNATIILEVLPNYTQLLINASEASMFISNIKKKHRDSRDNYYTDCKPYYKMLRDSVNKLTVATPLINVKSTEKADTDRKETRRFITTTSLSFLAICIAVIIALN